MAADTSSRVYKIVSEGSIVGLVKAKSPSTALKTHVGEKFKVSYADQDDLILAITDGVKVVDASAADQEATEEVPALRVA